MKEAYTQGLESEEDDDSLGDQIEPRDVGHNIYILAHQVRREKKGPEFSFDSDKSIFQMWNWQPVGVMEYMVDLFYLKISSVVEGANLWWVFAAVTQVCFIWSGA